MASSFTTEAFSLLGVGIVVIALRVIARTTSVGVTNLQFDDYLMCGAAVIYSLETATAYAVGAWWFGLANNGMMDEQRRTLDPTSHEYHLRVGGSKTQLVGWSLYTLLLWTLKLCMCHFYSRLTLGIHHLEVRVKIGYVLIAITYVATELSILLGCRPFSANWQIYPDPGNHCQPAVSKIDLYVTVVLNVVTDAYLMSIPMPMLWKANLEIKRKLSLILVFGGGVFVMMAGILRCALIIKDPVNGAQAAGSWACRETFVAVVIGNAPMIYPLFRRGVEKAYSSSGLSRYGPSSNRNTDGANSLPLKSSLSKPARRGKLRSVNALPTTYHDDVEEGVVGGGWDSKERIFATVVEVDGGSGRGSAADGSSASSSVRDAVVKTDSTTTTILEEQEEGGGDERQRGDGGEQVADGRGLKSVKGSAVSRRRSDNGALGGIKVTREATVSSEERGRGGLAATDSVGLAAMHQGARSPSPPHAGRSSVVHGHMDANGAVEMMTVTSESRFEYREEGGLEYTAYVGRG